MEQIPLTLKHKITSGKKLERLTIPCSDEFLKEVDKVASRLGQKRAEFAYAAVLEKMKEAIGEIFMRELLEDKKLSELL